jgi:ribonuclease-3
MSDYLILGEGELKSGGFNRDSILADTIESVIGALYLDASFKTASDFIHRYFQPQFDAISEESTFKDAKSRLQEAMQKRGLPLPSYQILETLGEQHNQEFTVECTLESLPISSTATARSRRSAEQKAAAEVLSLFNASVNT